MNRNGSWYKDFSAAWWLLPSNTFDSSPGLFGTQQISNTSWEMSVWLSGLSWALPTDTAERGTCGGHGYHSLLRIQHPLPALSQAPLLSSNKTLTLFYASQNKEILSNFNQVPGDLFVLRFVCTSQYISCHCHLSKHCNLQYTSKPLVENTLFC